MMLVSSRFNLQYFGILSSSKLQPTYMVEVLSELENNTLFVETITPVSLDILSAYYTLYILSLILDHDVNEARCLLQRVPTSLLDDPQLANVAALVGAVYTHNYPSVYSTLSNRTWCIVTIPVRDRVYDDFKRTAFVVLSKAYTSIIPAFIAFYFPPGEDIVNDLVVENSAYDPTMRFLKPFVSYGISYHGEMLRFSLNDERIERLTGLVTHLTEV
ncbi:hypothetical protein K440DRAFT_660822 [Wilcoxina mikolae CBS 423.85]|nr:hypothetical protein K440DRAFT_660822 [Wilcoxina mikolae CBS 423.85]